MNFMSIYRISYQICIVLVGSRFVPNILSNMSHEFAYYHNSSGAQLPSPSSYVLPRYLLFIA